VKDESFLDESCNYGMAALIDVDGPISFAKISHKVILGEIDRNL
jgi:hypothetical protein